MSRKTIRTVLIFCFGLIAGVFLYIHFGVHSDNADSVEDSLLVNNLYADPPVDDANLDISFY